MAKYDEEFKHEVVQCYLSGSAGSKSIALRYGLDHSTVRHWVASYRQHGLAGLRKKHSCYSAQFKHEVLQRMWREELSYRQVVALFDLRGGPGVVSAWERQYHEGGLAALKPKPRDRRPKMTAPESPKPPKSEETLEELRKQNEYLRAEVAYLKKLNALVRAGRQVAQNKRKP